MAPMFSLRAFYFYLILICCFLEIFGRGGGRGGGGRGGGGRGSSGGFGRGGYGSYGSRSSSSSGTSRGTGNYGSGSSSSYGTSRGTGNYGSRSSSSSGTSSGTGNYGSSSTIHGTDNSYAVRIGHNFNGNSNSEKFNYRQPSSSGFDINSNYKQNNRPPIDWNYQEKQREIDESLERIKNWRLGSFDSHKYRSTYENPYGSTFKNPYETILKDLPKEQQRIFSESGLYTQKADTHNSASIPAGSLSTIRNQELKGVRFRNSRRNSVGSSRCDVRKLTNDLNISWVCTRIKKQKECTIKCIEPKKFSGIAADKYTCRHGIWTPNHVPRCI